MTTTAEIATIKQATRRATTNLHMTPDQVGDAVDLAVDLYRVASHHGINMAAADGVTSFPLAAVDAVVVRDRQLLTCATPVGTGMVQA